MRAKPEKKRSPASQNKFWPMANPTKTKLKMTRTASIALFTIIFESPLFDTSISDLNTDENGFTGSNPVSFLVI